MILIGINCRDDILRIKNEHISFVAVFLSGLSFCNSSIAFNPEGVAAQPRPNIFATIFVLIYSFAFDSSDLEIKKSEKGLTGFEVV